MADGEIDSKHLPTEILVEILSRLPLKSFNRFKAVSKSWLALSTDPYYSKKFHKFRIAGLFCKLEDIRGHRSSRIHFASLAGSDAPLLDATMTNFPHRSDCDLELLDCCNGLLLFRCQTVEPPCFYISNPFTKKWIPILTPTNYHGRFILAYDVSISPHFQVLFFEINKRDNAIINLAILSSETSQWKQISVVWPESEDLIITAEEVGSVLLNETLYLFVRGKILAMKLKGWSCYTIQLPDITVTVNDRIAKCKGMLQLIHI
ncbi:hypothetical protein LUZ61_006303 [Rhynchospora tenuis]|uniref:F-box domain-containing protein n=1 Tax=Rhynchospora tenuis TaxID=198213 RepID=A0AAD6EVH0_9POAL|nr:hypothetical protein LUZ61_006303 [Rhynchospora tenuis]